jgi:ankyrin repeat protein
MDINKELFELLKKNKLEEFKKLLNSSEDIDVNIRDENNNYLLAEAIHMTNYELINSLIKKGAKLDIVDTDGRPILYIPINRGLNDLLKILLEENKHQIGVPIVDIYDSYNKIPLHYAINRKNIDAVKLLLEYGSNVNYKDKDGLNALHMAVYARSYDICKLVINHGVNINSICDTGETALHIACNLSLLDIVELLIKHKININKQDFEHHFTAFHYAVNINNKNIIMILLKNDAGINIQDAYGNTVIHYCIMEHNLEILEIIVMNTKEKINFNLWNIEGKIPLHLLFDDVPDRLDDYLNIILSHSNLNIQENKEGNSGLHYLCRLNIWASYEDTLKNNKIDIFICNKKGKRPIDYIKKDKLDHFLDIITQSYIRRLRLDDTKWEERWDNVCSRELYEITSKEKNELNVKIKNELNVKINENNKNDLCPQIIKKKLYNILNETDENKRCSIPSYPIKKTSINIQLSEGDKIQFPLFTGSTLDVLIGLVYLLKKHKNACSTLTKDFIENTSLCNYYKSIGIIMSNRCEFLNFEIVWVQYKLHLIQQFDEHVLNCLKNSDKRFIIFAVGIELREGSHANYLIYDKKQNEVERFESHGYSVIGLNYNGELLDNLLEKKFKSIIPGIIYVRPQDYLPKIGFQLVDVTEKNKVIGDPGGYCALWSIWYTDMRLSYPDLPRSKLVNKLFIIMRKKNISFKNMIRNYTINIINIRDKIFNKANIDINDWMNESYTEKQFNTIIDEIKNEIITI